MKLHLPIVRNQKPGQPYTIFTVQAGPVSWTPPEPDRLKRYGAPPLEDALAKYGGVVEIARPLGLTVEFTDVTLAQQFVDALHAACKATQAYWHAADGFTRNQDYDSASK